MALMDIDFTSCLEKLQDHEWIPFSNKNLKVNIFYIRHMKKLKKTAYIFSK